MPRLQTGAWDSIPDKGKRVGTRALYLGVKWLGYDAEHSYSGKVKNAWSYTFIPSLSQASSWSGAYLHYLYHILLLGNSMV
jgi:hypothetical protein